jgi:hypothetical protein
VRASGIVCGLYGESAANCIVTSVFGDCGVFTPTATIAQTSVTLRRRLMLPLPLAFADEYLLRDSLFSIRFQR